MIYKKRADDIVKAARSVTRALLRGGIPRVPVMIKPNIVTNDPPPTTTDVKVVAGIIEALRESKVKEITVAEGSGSGDTLKNLDTLGYWQLGVKLIDLDQEKTVSIPVKNFTVWKNIQIPEILLSKYIISVPVLKDHSMCGVSISLKNMVGVLPAHHYSGYWSYKKSQIHKYGADGCIADIIRVVRPDWAIVDASIGMHGSHLSGIPIRPPLNLVYGSKDALDADKFGCTLLNKRWEDIAYLRLISQGAVGI
jgi:uncharacterized protein (DUF362 family)